LDATFTGSGNNAVLNIRNAPGTVVQLGGTNDRVKTDDHNQVVIGKVVGGGTVKLLTATALAAATENVLLHNGTLDLNGQTAVRAKSIVLQNGSSSRLVNNAASSASFS